jgi:phage recombination protein Bet
MTNQLTPVNTAALSKEFGMTASQLSVITNAIAKGANTDELRYFMAVAKKAGLDPLTKQIHFVKRKSRNLDGTYTEIASIQTGIDGYRAIAERTGTLAGIDDAIYDKEDDDHPNKASVTVYRMVAGNKVPFTASARWKEYCQTRTYQGQTKPMGLWEKMPYLMLAKCAEALALRKAFPNDLSGIYTNEEMQQADNQMPIAPPATPAKTVEAPQEREMAPQDNEEPEYVPVSPEQAKEAIEGEIEANQADGHLTCAVTGVRISQAEYDYSMRFFKMPLSREAQKQVKSEQDAAARG